MRFPPHILDDIRARIPITEVIGRRVTWDKRKSNPSRGDYWACCPFHGEKTPSFHAEDRKGRYHCFGCGVSGDHFTFLVEHEGLAFPDAVQQLAAEAGVALPERERGDDRRERARASLHEVMEKAARFFEAALSGPEGAKARAYLRDRGLTASTLKRFRIGYAPASRKALKEHLGADGVSTEQMVEAGLLVAGEDIPVPYDRFRDRVIFPIADLRGRVIAFGGRALGPDVQAKYLNSPETVLFSKSRVLFNGQAARAASRKHELVVVEGYMDVVACVSAGFEAAVAPLGTALTEDQLRLLWQMADEPILCFDGDEAGLKAAYRAVDVAMPQLQAGKSLRFALLPDGLDPDDLIRRDGPEGLRKALAAARPMIDVLWMRETLGQDLSTPERRAGLEQTLRQAAATIGNADVRRHYEMALRERTRAQFGRRAFDPARQPRRFEPRGGGGGGRPRRFDAAREPIDASPSQSLLSNPLVRGGRRSAGPTISDAVLIGCLLMHPEIAADRLELFGECRFTTPAMAALAADLGLILADRPETDAAALSALLERSGHAPALEAVREKLSRTGLATALRPDPVHAAAVWDDAAHLRLRTSALSIERQAAAEALGRDASDFHLIRLRDIQEQDLRSLHPVGLDGKEEAPIVHPFKRR